MDNNAENLAQNETQTDGNSDSQAEDSLNAETVAGHAANEAAASPDAQASAAQPASAEQPASVPQTDEERVAALSAAVTELQAKVEAEHDLYLRKAADFENYRKRSIKEKQEAIDFANTSLLLDLIPILDDFERALAACAANGAEATLIEGIAMIETRLRTQLENKWGLKRFDSAGTPFDPEKHEALMSEPSPDVEAPTVAEDFMKGYTLKERVIRPAKVKVVMPVGSG